MFSIRRVLNLFSKCQLVSPSLQSHNFSTLQTQVPDSNIQRLCHNVFSKLQPCQSILQENQSAPHYNLDTVRTKVRYHYFPRAEKRISKHGLEKRLSSRSQREILFRRIIRGRHTLSTFDRFTNQLPGQYYKKSRRINLFDRRQGYKKPEKPELYRI